MSTRITVNSSSTRPIFSFQDEQFVLDFVGNLIHELRPDQTAVLRVP